MAVRTPHLTRYEELCWIVIAFSLGWMEIRAIQNDRLIQETSHNKELQTQREEFEKSLAHLGIIESGVQGIPRIEGEISRIKPNVTVLPPSAFGNLKQRCNQLSASITQLVKHRYDQLQNAPAYARPLTPEKILEWRISNNNEFRGGYFGSQVETAKTLRDELAQLHIQDARLDSILSSDDRNQMLAKSNPQIPQLSWINISDMEQIAERLLVLSSMLP